MIFILLSLNLQAHGQDTLKVILAGNPPFLIENDDNPKGIAIDIWEELAYSHGIDFEYAGYTPVDEALKKIQYNEADVLVGPVSITSDRAEVVRFTQPFYISSYSIVSSKRTPSLWRRISPFFSKGFFLAVSTFLLILSIVGALLWLAERRQNAEQFPSDLRRGIPLGIWLAVVTMTTVGYGDMAPKTVAGRIIAGVWMVVALITATSLVAGIASTLTVSGINPSIIQKVQHLSGKKVAVVGISPADEFIQEHGGIIQSKTDLDMAFEDLKSGKVDAIIFDRPQLIYYKESHPEETEDLIVGLGEYLPQGYGFVTAMDSPWSKSISVYLLEMQEEGEIAEIVRKWLGKGGKE